MHINIDMYDVYLYANVYAYVYVQVYVQVCVRIYIYYGQMSYIIHDISSESALQPPPRKRALPNQWREAPAPGGGDGPIAKKWEKYGKMQESMGKCWETWEYVAFMVDDDDNIYNYLQLIEFKTNLMGFHED